MITIGTSHAASGTELVGSVADVFGEVALVGTVTTPTLYYKI